MTQIDETIASYLTALKIEGKTPATIASYANSLEDFRRVGRRLGAETPTLTHVLAGREEAAWRAH